MIQRVRADAAEKRGHGEAELAQRGAEKRVLLETVAAAVGGEELAGDGIDVDADSPAALDLEIVKRERGQMRDVQAAQCFDRRRQRLRETEAGEIGVEVHPL